jgi:hypothetical protein
MRRILLASLAFFGVVIVVLLVFWLLQPHPRIDAETCEKIQAGMTEREVIDIIGAPAGDYGVGKGEIEIYTRGYIWKVDDPRVKNWLGQEKAIEIVFTDEGKVESRALRDVWRPYESQLDRILQMLQLKERRQRLDVEIF